MSDVWSVGTYERLSVLFEPVHDELIRILKPQAGERWLDVATGAGEVAVRAAAHDASVTAIDVADPIVERARRHAAEVGVNVRFDVGNVEYLPYDDAFFDVLVSSFGLIFAPDHANVASELARVARPGARLAFTAWKPTPKLGELYRQFTEEPIEGREAYEWGREDHVEDMLGEHFELDFVDGTLTLDAESPDEVWELFSSSAPPVVALLDRLDEAGAAAFHRAFVELYEGYREADGVHVPRRYLLVLGRRR